MSEYTRFAVFYAPPKDSGLARFGAEWLGWDAEHRCEARPADPPDGWSFVTARPRKYGFHGTLKPPFRLREGADVARLTEEVGKLAARTPAVTCPALKLSRLGPFFALMPGARCDRLGRLAADVVVDLDPLRAPAGEGELAKRRAGGLTAQQEQNLVRYGYPYVLDEFRFHLTLTGPLAPEQADAIEPDLRRATAPFCCREFTVSELCLFGEHEGGSFHIIERFPLAAVRVGQR